MKIKRNEDLTNCSQGKGLIEFGGGQAPKLDYSIPQSTSFSSYGDIELDINPKAFTDLANKDYTPSEAEIKKIDIANFVMPTLLSPTALQIALGKHQDNLGLNALKETGGKKFTGAIPAVLGGKIFTGSVSALGGSVFKGEDGLNLLKGGDKFKGTPEGLSGFKENAAASTYLTAMQQLQDSLQTGKFTLQAIDAFNGKDKHIKLIPRPEEPQPRLFIVEEYKTTSFAGNYGAGNTISIFTLLPGEKATISIKTYKEVAESNSQTTNIVDSFSTESANELENLIEEENNVTNSTTHSDTNEKTTSKTTSAGVSLSASGSFGLGKKLSPGTADAKAGASRTKTTGTSNTVSNTSARTANAKSLHKALDKHIDKTNSNRTNSVTAINTRNTKETTETSNIREIVNPNISRVLNIVYRECLQEFITITYLADIKIGFTNGHPESNRLVPIEHLDMLLNEIISEDKEVEIIKQHILCQYETVLDYDGNQRPFLELYPEEPNSKNCPDDITYFRKRPRLQYFFLPEADVILSKDELEADKLIDKKYTGMLALDVTGVILNVDKFTLKTDSLIGDALIGQASAIDCFNQNVQEEKKNELILNNLRHELALQTLELVTDPVQRAELYAKMFNPQQTIISN